MTVQTFIGYALRDLQVIYSGQTPSPDQSNDAANCLLEIVSNWNHEGLLVPTHALTSFSLTAATSAYTLGVGATWVTSGLPIKVKGAIASLSGFQKGVQVMNMGDFERSIENDVGLTAALPSKLGVDNAAPMRNVRVFPTPNNSSASLELSYWVPLVLFAALADTLTFALPAYELAVRDELTLRLAPMFLKPVTPVMISNAQASKLALTRIDPSEPPVPPAPPAPAVQR